MQITVKKIKYFNEIDGTSKYRDDFIENIDEPQFASIHKL